MKWLGRERTTLQLLVTKNIFIYIADWQTSTVHTILDTIIADKLLQNKKKTKHLKKIIRTAITTRKLKLYDAI